MNDALAALQMNTLALLPEVVLVGFVLLLLLVDSLGGVEPTHNEPQSPSRARATLPWLALLGVIAAAAVTLWLWAQPAASFQGQATSDRFALVLRLVLLLIAFLTILLSNQYIQEVNRQVGAYYALVLLCSAGMMLMAAATDLIVLFLAFEIFSLGLYVLTGLHRTNARSTEASMKYFLLGAFTSAFLVYGMALVYGAVGSTQYAAIAQQVNAGTADRALLYMGLGLMLVGFGFKASLVPFHAWTPDVYQGAPTPVTAFMSAGTKAAAFAALIRFLLVALPAEQATWGWILAIFATLTMVLGNLAALRQASLKRMLAYSTIAHAGYILVGLAPGTAQGADAALFYLFVYAFMNMGAFAVIMAMERTAGDDLLQSGVRGIGRQAPLLSFLLSLFLFSLSGMPPLAGFFGKLYVFGAAVSGGWTWLAVIGMLTSAIAVYYYIRVIVAMYFEKPGPETVTAPRTWGTLQIGLAVAAAFTIVVGILPAFWTDLLRSGFGG